MELAIAIGVELRTYLTLMTPKKLMANIEGSLWSIEYRGYCPDGWPKRLAEMFIPGNAHCPPEIRNFPITLGGGYSITHTWISRPVKPLSQESLAKVRRKRAERRIRAKVPMFADQFLAQELGRKPDYYNGITDPHIEAMRKQAQDEDEHNFIERNSRPGVLIVWADEPQAAKDKAAENYAAMEVVRIRLLPKVTGQDERV